VIPLRDTVPASRPPVLTILLIILNGIVFFLELRAGAEAPALLRTHGLIPVREVAYLTQAAHRVDRWIPPLFTSMFLHGGWLHIIGNMWYLWIFGDNVEDRLGRGRFLFLYLACGLVAAFAQIASDPESTVPVIGASGAIAGVLGAYLMLFPRSRVITLVPLLIVPYIVRIPAVIFLGAWFALQLSRVSLSLTMVGSRDIGGIAWWAHLGGFGAGFVLALLVGGRRPRAAAGNDGPLAEYPYGGDSGAR
jgi:membrane associated rhomboid family serine protease